MNLKNVNFGIPLSKNEQRAIKGGIACLTGQWVECNCADGTSIPSPIMPMGEIAIAWCINNGVCSNDGGTQSTGPCMD